MTYQDKVKLTSLLIELDVKELNDEENYFMDNRNKREALKISKVREAVDTLINYLNEE